MFLSNGILYPDSFIGVLLMEILVLIYVVLIIYAFLKVNHENKWGARDGSQNLLSGIANRRK